VTWRTAGAAVFLATLLIAGCGKGTPAPKVDAGEERAEALERAKKGAFGTQVQAVEAAKGLGADLNQKALDAVEKAEKDAR
jgi:outer membrane murein-binding lipoprotein Lpp